LLNKYRAKTLHKKGFTDFLRRANILIITMTLHRSAEDTVMMMFENVFFLNEVIGEIIREKEG